MAEIWPTHGPTAPTNTQTNTRKHRAGAGVTLGDDLEFKFWAFYADLGVLRGYGPIWAVCCLQTRPHAEFWPTCGPTVPGHTHASVWKRHTGGGVPRAAVSNLIGGICGSILGLISAGFWGRFGPKLAAKLYHAQWIGQPMAVRPHHTPGKDRGSTVAAIWDPLANVFGRSE